jgi:hypothetical protein
VLSPELELTDLDARHWKNWWRLLTPPRVLDAPRWALAVLDAGRVIKLVIAGEGARGAIDPASAPLPGLSPGALAAWARTLGVGAVIAIDRAVISKLSSEIESALGADQDLIAQGLIALRALKKQTEPRSPAARAPVPWSSEHRTQGDRGCRHRQQRGGRPLQHAGF